MKLPVPSGSPILLLVFVLYALVNGNIHAQVADTTVNQQIDALYDEAWAYSRTQPDSSLAILEQVKALHTKQDKAYRADVLHYYYGILYKNLNRWEESEAAFDEYESFHAALGDTLSMALAIMAKANLFSDKGDFASSTEAASKALNLYETFGDTLGMIRTGSKLGYLLTEVERYGEALEYHRRSNALARAVGERKEEAITYTNMGLLYEKENQLDSAHVAYRKAYEIAEGYSGNYDKLINRYNLATILQKLDRLDEAVPYVQACMSLSDSINIPTLRVASYQLYASIQLDQGNVDRAITLLDSLSGPLDHDLGLRNKMELYRLRAEAYWQKGDYKTAYAHYTTYKALNDSLLGAESRNKLNELEVKYETARQKQRIAYLDLENKVSQSLIRQKDRTILIGGVGLVLTTLFATILYILFRKYQRQKKVLDKALADKDLLLREIHHRVKNNLQIVSSLLSLQGRSLNDESALQAINAGKSRVRSMALIHQSLYQRENLTGVNVQEYLKKLSSELFHSFNIEEKRIDLDLQVDPIELDVDTLVPLGLVVNELITNALKYAFPDDRSGKLKVSMRKSEDVLKLEVIDDGVGFDPEKIRDDSFGQKLVGSLVKQLKGALTIETGNGTRVILEVHKFSAGKSI